MTKKEKRSRAWCFTINNDTFNDLESLLEMEFRYMAFGFEQGTKKGTDHIQGYIYYDNARTFLQVQNLFSYVRNPDFDPLDDYTNTRNNNEFICRAHLEIAKGSPKQNYDYTSKDGDFYEFGEIPDQGRAKWDKIVEVMKDPTSNIHLFQQYNKTYRALTYCKKKEHQRSVVIVQQRYKFDTYAKFSSICTNYETYDDEEAVSISSGLLLYSAQSEDVVRNWAEWYHGYPVKVKRGYEIVTVDPTFLVILVPNEKYKQLRGLIQKVFGENEVFINEFVEDPKYHSKDRGNNYIDEEDIDV